MRQVSGKPKTVSQVIGNVAEDALAVAVVALTLLGIGGMVYKAFKPDGWLSLGLGHLWDKSPGLVWLAAFSVAAATLLAKHFFDRGRRAGTRGDVIGYAFVALGLFFFIKLLITGTI